MTDVTRADPDLLKGHGLLQQRLPLFEAAAREDGFALVRTEVYRPDARQRWLYGQGRTAQQLEAEGLDPTLARPGLIVTNAKTAKFSAHGLTLADGTPAAAAGDYALFGADGKLWTPDDPWEEWMVWCGEHEDVFGIRHFHAPGKQVTDKPHVQLVEWDDATHRLLLGGTHG